jgi:hypothetical protein
MLLQLGYVENGYVGCMLFTFVRTAGEEGAFGSPSVAVAVKQLSGLPVGAHTPRFRILVQLCSHKNDAKEFTASFIIRCSSLAQHKRAGLL